MLLHLLAEQSPLPREVFLTETKIKKKVKYCDRFCSLMFQLYANEFHRDLAFILYLSFDFFFEFFDNFKLHSIIVQNIFCSNSILRNEKQKTEYEAKRKIKNYFERCTLWN